MSDELDALLDAAFATSRLNPVAETHAVLVQRNGETVAERYAPGFDATSTFISWSMAKSMASAACGMLIADGALELDAPAPVPEWQEPGDPRSTITLRHLLQMRSGLEWVEDYVDGGISDVIEMLFQGAKDDVAAYAVAKQLEAAPGDVWKYSSGTTNIISRILGDIISPGVTGSEREIRTRAFLRNRLFGPLGMESAEPKFDPAGTWIASSFVYATARDFARFGQLYLDGGRDLLSAEWVAESVRSHATDPESGQGYGLQWWTTPGPVAMFSANGYEGQRIQVAPHSGVVMVRLGKTEADYGDELRSFYAAVMAATC